MDNGSKPPPQPPRKRRVITESERTIFRIAERKSYTCIENTALINPALTWEARGLLHYLLSKPDDWETRMSDLIRASPDGICVVRRIIKELIAACYMERHRYRRDDGTFAWVCYVYEEPYTTPRLGYSQQRVAENNIQPVCSFPPMVVPSVDEPSAENLPVTKYGEVPITNIQSTDGKEFYTTEINGQAETEEISGATGNGAAPQNWLDALQMRVPRNEFERWLQPAVLVKVAQGVAIIAVPTPFHKERLEDRYGRQIQRVLSELHGHIHRLIFTIKEQENGR